MKSFRRKAAGLLAVIMTVSSLLTVSVAAAPIEPYTHWDTVTNKKETVYGREMYEAVSTISATTLGLDEKMDGITDLFCAKDGTVYILCGNQSRLVVLNKDYSFRKVLDIVDSNGNAVDYKGARGMFVDEQNTIYIADTEHAQVLIASSDGIVRSTMKLPDSPIIPQDFNFSPTRVVRDTRGYTYVLSLGSYYGALLYSPEGSFLGFYGANTVKSTVLDSLAYIWDLITSNDTKKSQSTRKLPYAFVDLCTDQEGYIYTCTGSTSVGGTNVGQIRMLSPGGTVILYKRQFDGSASSSTNFNFLEQEAVKRLQYWRTQNMVSLDVNDDGYIFALDQTYGKIYVYDKDCNLLTVFGGGIGQGDQLGLFSTAETLAVNGTQLLVADSKLCTVTVYDRTEYGALVQKADTLYMKGDYVAAKPEWEKVLMQDANNRLAYRGLAKAYYDEGNIDNALKYSRKGMDFVTYDNAHQKRINDFVESNFTWLFLIALALIGGLVAFLIYIRKRESALISNVKVHTLFSSIMHPFQAFTDVKYKNLGSVPIAVLLMVLFFVTTALKYTASGFLFNQNDMQSYSSLFTLAQTIGLILLWSVANWAVCTIFSGKGKFKEVLISSSYSVLPLIIYNLLFVVLSHVISLSGVELVNGLYTIFLIYTFFILTVSMLTIHEYSFSKFLLTTIVTVLFMILIVFIIFMIVILLQQFGDFLYSVYMEAVYR